MKSAETHQDRIQLLNQIQQLANALNGEWEPNWGVDERKWIIVKRPENFIVMHTYSADFLTPAFKTREIAEQAIEILNQLREQG